MNILLKLLLHFPQRIGDAIIHILFRTSQGTSRGLRDYYKIKYKVEVGCYTYGGCFDRNFNQGGEVVIGRYCSIANNVHYFGANHPLSAVSSSAYFYNKSLSGENVKDVPRNKLTIGNDVWIGYGTIITCSCKTIETGAVIGAGTIVTHDVPANAIVAGNPARIIRYRHADETFTKLYKTKWWNRDLKYLMRFYESMDDPETFCEKMLKEEERL